MAGHGPHPRWRSWLERRLLPLVRRHPVSTPDRDDDVALAASARELYRSEARRAQVLEAVPDGICVSRDGRIVYGNRAMAKLVGLREPEEAIGRLTFDFIDEEFHDAIRRGRTVASDGVMYGPSEIRLRRVDGSTIAAELRVVAVDDGEGRGFLNVVRDLTAQKAAEAQEKLRSTVLEQSTDGVVVVNDRGRIVYVNPAFCELRNAPASKLIGQSMREIFVGIGASGVDLQEIIRMLLSGDIWRGRYTLRDERGEFHRDTRCFVVRSQSGEIHSFVALVRDVSPEVELERGAEQARKLEAVGQLAGGVAHDLNNLLTVILGQLEMLSVASPRDPAVRVHTRAIGEAVERSASRVRQILAFGGRQPLAPRVIDVAQVVNAQRVLLEELAPDGVGLVFDLAAALPPVRIDPSVIQQALNELVMNARDAQDGSGTIRVLARAHDGGVALSVEDDGLGMDSATRNRATEPFFTTRATGNGLGLATTHGLVTHSGGSVEIESEPGRGTRVRLLLPGARVAPPSETARRADAPETGAASEGHETLLVVEDEDRLRALAVRALSSVGYRVLEASSAGEAREVAASFAGPIDLLVSDVVLPGIDGVELASRLRLERPGLRILLMSGYVPESAWRDRGSSLGARFLEKPFRMGDLRACVREALDEDDATGPG